jgi:DNA-binding NarL/FixJ family response regulator
VKVKVFIADDSARLREQLLGMLSELNGIEIIGQAQDAAEALQAICKLKPDVVTLDIQMIGGSGIEVLKQIKQAALTPVVIMLTNRTSLPYRKRCLEAGADFFLDKSTEFGKVREIIQNLFERFDATVAKAP